MLHWLKFGHARPWLAAVILGSILGSLGACTVEAPPGDNGVVSRDASMIPPGTPPPDTRRTGRLDGSSTPTQMADAGAITPPVVKKDGGPVAPGVDGGVTSPPDGGTDAGGGADAGTAPMVVAGYQFCVPCHGADGAGVPMKGPEIRHPVLELMTYLVRNGRTHPGYMEPMPKVGPAVISDEQLRGIHAFLTAFPKPTTGKGLYEDFCVHCHGVDARGGVTMHNISTQPMSAFLMDPRAGHHPGEFMNRRGYMPKWTAAELSDAELRLIFTYVDGL